MAMGVSEIYETDEAIIYLLKWFRKQTPSAWCKNTRYQRHRKKYIKNYMPNSERCIQLQLNAKLLNINIIQEYATTADKLEEGAAWFYEQLEHIMKSIDMDDFNQIEDKSNSGKRRSW